MARHSCISPCLSIRPPSRSNGGSKRASWFLQNFISPRIVRSARVKLVSHRPPWGVRPSDQSPLTRCPPLRTFSLASWSVIKTCCTIVDRWLSAIRHSPSSPSIVSFGCHWRPRVTLSPQPPSVAPLLPPCPRLQSPGQIGYSPPILNPSVHPPLKCTHPLPPPPITQTSTQTHRCHPGAHTQRPAVVAQATSSGRPTLFTIRKRSTSRHLGAVRHRRPRPRRQTGQRRWHPNGVRPT